MTTTELYNRLLPLAAERTGADPLQVRKIVRVRPAVRARRLIALALRECRCGGVEMSWPIIAETMGYRSHASAFDACRGATDRDRREARQMLREVDGKDPK